jgi:hypothetical protein
MSPVIKTSFFNGTQLNRHHLKTEEDPFSERLWILEFLYICILHFILHFIHIKGRWTESKKQGARNDRVLKEFSKPSKFLSTSKIASQLEVIVQWSSLSSKQFLIHYDFMSQAGHENRPVVLMNTIISKFLTHECHFNQTVVFRRNVSLTNPRASPHIKWRNLNMEFDPSTYGAVQSLTLIIVKRDMQGCYKLCVRKDMNAVVTYLKKCSLTFTEKTEEIHEKYAISPGGQQRGFSR